MRRCAALLAALGLLATATPAAAEQSTAYNAATGIGAALATVVYAPFKLVYATGGTLVSGLAWIFTLGDTSIAGPILRGAARGDYVVTPAHLSGESTLHFDGRRF